MACNLSVNSLEIRNVNESATVPLIIDQQDGFVLQEPNIFTSCTNNTVDPFATFCLIPKNPDNDPMGSNMCSLALTQTEQPNSLFERMIRGDIQFIDQMEVIWESAKIVVSNPLTTWIDIQQMEHITTNDGDYLGLGPVDDFDAIAASNNGSVLNGVREGQLFENYPDGFVRKNELVQGQNNQVQNVTVSPNGFVRATWFSNKLFFYVNQTWMEWNENQPEGNIFYYQNVKLWTRTSNTTFVYIAVLGLSEAQDQWHLFVFQFTDNNSNNIGVVLQPIANFGQTLENGVFRLGGITVSSNNETILVCTFQATTAPNTMDIHSVDAQTPTQEDAVQYNRWNCVSSRFQTLLTPLQDKPVVDYSAALCDQQTVEDAFFVLMTLRILSFTFTLPLPAGPVTDLQFLFAEQPFRGMRLNESVDHVQRLYVYNSQLRTTLSHIPPLIPENQPFSLIDVSDEKPFVFALSYTLNSAQAKIYDAWIFRNHGVLYRLSFVSNAALLRWTSNFNLYNSQLAKISDFGIPGVLDPAVYVPGATWYLGTLTQAMSVPPITRFPSEIVRSKHQTFRYVATGSKTQDPIDPNVRTFSYVVVQLQRANEYGLARSAESVTLANNSNVIMNENVWSSNTTDQIGDETSTNTLNLDIAPFAVSSPNGLYLLYVTSNFKMRLVFNNFNNVRFAEWNKPDTERLGKAIDIQSNFCWNSLKIPTDKVPGGSSLFTDFRCMCIGGPRLFAITAPNAENIPEGVLGPLEQNMPCVTTSCNLGINNSIEDTETNVEIYTKLRCSNRVFSICQNTIDLGPGSSLINVDIITPQLCGINQVTCSENNPCGPDQVCENGRCVPKCTTDKECTQMFGNSFNLRCMNTKCQLIEKPPSTLNTSVIVAIICGIFLLFLILLLVGLMAKRNKRKSS